MYTMNTNFYFLFKGLVVGWSDFRATTNQFKFPTEMCSSVADHRIALLLPV